MRLLLFRHGIAEDFSPSGTDFDRRLTDRGYCRTAAAARGLAVLCEPPGVILTSPKVRARQTAELAAEAFGVGLRVEEALAHGSARDILAAVGERGEPSVMAVGHEPTLSQVIDRVLGGGHVHGGYLMKKAGAALMEIDFRHANRDVSGFLHWLIPPKALRALDPQGEHPD